MKNASKQESSQATNLRFHHSLAAAVLIGSSLLAQTQYQGQTYGQPSEWQQGTDAVLSLSLTELGTGMSALRLEGGTPGAPAYLAFASERSETEMQGATLLISNLIGIQAGSFDHAGVFLFLLSEEGLGSRDELYVQGLAPSLYPAGSELSAGLWLSEKTEAPQPPELAPQPPEEILVEEFGDLMLAGYLEAAIDLGLNSKGDSLELELKGSLQVPIFVGVTAGGKAAFKAVVKRGENQDGAVVYDLAIGADVAAAAGVGIGIAGAGLSAGAGYDAIWRYESSHEVARAIRSMVILQAVGRRIELASLALNTKLADIDRGIRTARRIIDNVRRVLRSWMPWRNNPIVRRMQRLQDQLIAERRRMADAGHAAVNHVINFIAEERIFITSHLNGFEIRSTVVADISVGGKASDVELKASAEAERKFSLHAEFVPESEAISYEQKVTFTNKFEASASLGLGIEGNAKREIELSQKIQVGKSGLHLEESGTTVKITLDRAVALSLGMVVSGKAAVGGEVSAELRLEDLLGYSLEAIEILTGDDNLKFAELLLAFPIKFAARGRYEAGFEFDLSFEAKGLGDVGIGAEAKLVDWTESLVYEGGSTGDEFLELMRQAVDGVTDSNFISSLELVKAEVQSVMQH